MSGGNAAKLVVGVLALWLLAAADPAVSGPAPLAGPVDHGPDPASVDRLPELRLRPALSAAWCGTTRADDDLEHEVPNGTYKYHAIYAVPSDAPARFGLVAGRLQTDVFQASGLLERLYGRALRLDMGTSCGPGYLDISVVRLASTTAQLEEAAASPYPWVFDRVVVDLRAAGFAVIPTSASSVEASAFTKNLIVWLDGPAPAGMCGEADYYDDPTRGTDNWNNFGGKLALIYKFGSEFCGSNTVRHEIGHNLGALQPGAPSAFDGAHCDDAYEDTMCYAVAPRRSSGEANALFFDYGNDDYWDPPGRALSRWTVNLSRFVCPTVECNGLDATAGVAVNPDGDALPGAVDRCPATPGTDCDATADAARPAGSSARATVTRRKVTRHRWRVRVRVRGRGRARVRVLCGHRRRRARVVRVPASPTFRVRCDRRVRVRTRALRPQEKR